MELVILGIGLVLGVLCGAVWARVQATERATKGAHASAALAATQRDMDLQAIKTLSDKTNRHDHEIATLYDRAGLRRQ